MESKVIIALTALAFLLPDAAGTTKVQAADGLGVRLELPTVMAHPGDEFWVRGYLDNPGPEVLYDVPICFVLEVYGEYWFWPSWAHYAPPEFTDYDLDWREIPVGSSTIEVVEPFTWPDTGDDKVLGLYFNGLMLTDDMSAVRGAPAIVEFGYGPRSDTPTPAPTGFVYIPPVSFTMGSPSDEACRVTDEPQHFVTLTHGFHMMATEVTRGMWADLKAVQPTLPSDPSETYYSPTMNHPVQYNTWYEAVLFANLMSVQYGFTRCYYTDSGFTTPVDASNYTSGPFYCNFNATGYRLPTEAEWEYACRAGTTGPFSCNEPNYNSGNCSSCTAGTHPTLEQYCVYCANDPGMSEVVGSKLPNPAGLYDIHGNVWEWCWDWYARYPAGSVTDPTGPSSGWDRVLRGGGWDNSVQFCRSADRHLYAPGVRYDDLGFRLLRISP